MGKDRTKADIIKRLRKHRREVLAIMKGFEALDETDDDGRVNRNLINQIVFTLFDTVDEFVSTEIDIHNYLYRRG